jgi:ribose transport system permease protein
MSQVDISPLWRKGPREKSPFISAGIFIVLYGLLIVISPVAGTPFLINNFLVLMSPLAIAAVGTTLILVLGGFDLSVAGTISLANVVAATAMQQSPDDVWLIAVGIITMGAVIGLINGFLIATLALPALGVTLSTNIVLAGIALVIMPAPGGQVPLKFTSVLTGMVGPVPFAAFMLVVLALFWVGLMKTRTGMAITAVGGDPSAARLSGIPVKRVSIVAYAIAGSLYAGGGLYLSALTATGSPAAGASFLLTAFTAAALGLVSFRGGRGSGVAAIFGAGIILVIPKFLFSLGIADFWVGACQGFIVLLALTVPVIGRKISSVNATRKAAVRKRSRIAASA